jgi:hypothetical protein
MELSKEQIKEVAEFLDCGMICYIHKNTKEIKSIIDLNQPYTEHCEEEATELEEIERNLDKYIKIEKMSSRESFQIMEDFIDKVSNNRIRERLINALNRSRPFRNFKNEVDYNEEIRQHWFKFKAYKYQDWVINELKYLQREEEEEIEKTPPMIMGYFNDDGTPFNPGLHPLPNLCMSCKKRNNPHEEMICNLTRMDQMDEKEFKCFAYEDLNE